MAKKPTQTSKASFAKNPKSVDDSVSYTENAGITYFDVVANDGGAKNTTLYSVNDGSSTDSLLTPYDPDVTYFSAQGARIAIQAEGAFAGTISYESGLLYESLAQGQTITDTFIYATQAGNGPLTWATATITVTGTNDVPMVAAAVTASMNEDAVFTLNALFTASDVDAGTVLTVVDLPAQLPNGVTFDIATNSLTLDATHATYQGLARDQRLTVTVNFAVSDGIAKTAATASWTVIGTNDAPMVSGAVTVTMAEDATATLDALQNASDVDTGTALTVVGLPSLLPAGVTFDNLTNSFTLDTTNWVYQSLALGQSTTVTVSYGVSDGIATTPAIATWTVTGANDAPVVSGVVTVSATEDQVFFLNALSTASDVDSDTVLSVVDLPSQLPVGVTFNSATNSFALDATGATYQGLAFGQETAISVSYGVSDGLATVPATATWTVTGTNDAPVVSGVVSGTAIEGGLTVTLSALALASDIDAGAMLSVTSSETAEGVTFDQATQSFILDAAHQSFRHLAQGQSKTVTVNYAVTDGMASTPAAVSWTITGVNNAPIEQSGHTHTAWEDGGDAVHVLSLFSDPDDDAELKVVNVQAELPAGVRFDEVLQSFHLDASVVEFQGLAEGENTTVTVTYAVTDGIATTPASLSWVVTGRNDAPVISAPITVATAEDGAVVEIDALAHATDTDRNAVLSVVSFPETLPVGVAYDSINSLFTLDASHAAYQDLAAGQIERIEINYGVTDGQATTAASVLWTVTGTNDKPTISGPVTGKAFNNGAAITVHALANASDVDLGTVLTISNLPVTLPDGVIFNQATQTFTLDPRHFAYQGIPKGQERKVTVDYAVTDGIDHVNTSVAFTIVGTNSAPVVSGPVSGVATEDGATVFLSALANTSDTDAGAVLTITGIPTTLPGGVTYDAAAKGFRLNPAHAAYQPLAAGQQTTVTVNYGVTDGTDITAAQVFWTITGRNDAAIITGIASGSLQEDAILTASGTLQIRDVDSPQTFRVQTDVIGAYGKFSINANGQWTYTLDNSSKQVQKLAAGENTNDTFTVWSEDGSARKLVTMEIAGAYDNIAPVANDDFFATTNGININPGNSITEDLVVDLSSRITHNDTDPDSMTGMRVHSTSTLSKFGATVTISGNSVFYDPTKADALQALDVGQNIIDTFTYTVKDDKGLVSNPATVSVVVRGAAELDEGIAYASGKVVEDVSLSTSGKLNISDFSATATSFAVRNNSKSSVGTYSIDASGNWTYRLNNELDAIQRLQEGETRYDSLTVYSADLNFKKVITIEITGTNDAPVAMTNKYAGTITFEEGTARVAHQGYQGWVISSNGFTFKEVDVTYEEIGGFYIGEIRDVNDTGIGISDAARGENFTQSLSNGNDGLDAGMVMQRSDGGVFSLRSLHSLLDTRHLETGYAQGLQGFLGNKLVATGGGNPVNTQVPSEFYVRDNVQYLVSPASAYTDPDWDRVDKVIFLAHRSHFGIGLYFEQDIDNLATATPTNVQAAIDVLSEVLDVDRGSTFKVASFSTTSSHGAAISLNANGTLQYNPRVSQELMTLPSGQKMIDTFTYQVADDFGALSDMMTLGVTLIGVAR